MKILDDVKELLRYKTPQEKLLRQIDKVAASCARGYFAEFNLISSSLIEKAVQLDGKDRTVAIGKILSFWKDKRAKTSASYPRQEILTLARQAMREIPSLEMAQYCMLLGEELIDHATLTKSYPYQRKLIAQWNAETTGQIFDLLKRLQEKEREWISRLFLDYLRKRYHFESCDDPELAQTNYAASVSGVLKLLPTDNPDFQSVQRNVTGRIKGIKKTSDISIDEMHGLVRIFSTLAGNRETEIEGIRVSESILGSICLVFKVAAPPRSGEEWRGARTRVLAYHGQDFCSARKLLRLTRDSIRRDCEDESYLAFGFRRELENFLKRNLS